MSRLDKSWSSRLTVGEHRISNRVNGIGGGGLVPNPLGSRVLLCHFQNFIFDHFSLKSNPLGFMSRVLRAVFQKFSNSARNTILHERCIDHLPFKLKIWSVPPNVTSIFFRAYPLIGRHFCYFGSFFLNGHFWKTIISVNNVNFWVL